MKTLVIGDIHGCGLELQALLVKAGMDIGTDQVILVGDLFDRAKHAHIVWNIIQAWDDRIFVLLGNHEKKMLAFLQGKRPDVPKHYLWAINDLERSGVSKSTLIAFLESLPTIVVWSGGQIIQPGPKPVLFDSNHVIIAHAGIDIHYPLNPDVKYTVYGDVRKRGDEWWERYQGENLVLYGHLSELDCLPRVRTYKTGESNMGSDGESCGNIEQINSIGLDTACAHGGNLTGYIIETREFVTVKAERDWATELKHEMK